MSIKTALDFIDIGMDELESGEYEVAKEFFEDAADMIDTRERYWLKEATAELENGEYDEAEDHAQKAFDGLLDRKI
jgi:tetratricopeptide (TPR) repeat protein